MPFSKPKLAEIYSVTITIGARPCVLNGQLQRKDGDVTSNWKIGARCIKRKLVGDVHVVFAGVDSH